MVWSYRVVYMVDGKVNVIYEDNHIIVVEKPRNVLVQADNTNDLDLLTIVKKYLKEKYQKPGNVYLGLVHRLDLNTEGIMVLAKTSKAAKRLSLAIKDNLFTKEYLAVVEGVVTTGILENYLYKNEKEKKSYIRNDGKLARLEYNSLFNKKIDNNMTTICKIKLETGRFHQIRAQFANINHPLYGDKKYGSRNISRHCVLQAYKLIFKHPVTNEEMIFIRIDNDNYFKGVKDNL